MVHHGLEVLPGLELDGVAVDVAFAGGHVAAVAPAIPAGEAARVVNANGRYVVPGLVDAKGYVALRKWSQQFYDVPPEG